MADCNRRNQDFDTPQDLEAIGDVIGDIRLRDVGGVQFATSVTKKYGGLGPKKKPLISKDHERAFFDSADWALCKQGAGVNQKATAAIETLRPKLQRTPHQQLPPRRPACTSGSHASA